MLRPLLLFLTLISWVFVPALARARAYPCPSDPGFCYRDFGDDGCFDVGVDDGPINDEIEASFEFPPVPPPGSIVCPPSVKELIPSTVGDDIFIATEDGSSILLYAAKFIGDRFETMSGGELLMGGKTLGIVSATFSASDDVFVEADVRLQPKISGFAQVKMESLTGDVEVAPKVKIHARDTQIFAPAGDIRLLEGLVLSLRDGPGLTIDAGGLLDVARMKAGLKDGTQFALLLGSEIRMHGKSSIKTGGTFGSAGIIIEAEPGDVTIDQISIKTDGDVTISGENVTIGSSQQGSIPRSRIVENDSVDSVDILATNSLQIENLRLESAGDGHFQTMGSTLDLLGSRLKGTTGTPTMEVSAGAGSTCDLTGTQVIDANLVTNCDTVIGP